ncbi:PASTA domain-containing protein [Dactylosporangium sp. CS-033363]|uniref:PASTA domain-containing protein n=1 Tax=Dactylosporangium sp. CS-033363 TaxID=3239935 RepID=UPI003D8C3D34
MQPPIEERERWSARAGVPAPGDPSLRRPAPEEWVEEEDPYQGRSWLMPVVVGIVALVLAGAIAVGLYLIYRATADGKNVPGGIESSSASPVTTSAAPSEAPPPSAPPSSEAPPSEQPGPVAIPPLRGDSLAEATVKLQGLGLNVQVERTPDDSLPPGEVLSSRPGEGATVLPGETITLYVAVEPAPTTTRAQPSASASR